MNLRIAGNPLTHLASLPLRNGKRPITVRGPLHVQCSENSNEMLLGELVDEVAAWTGVQAAPLPDGSGGLVSLGITEDLASSDSANFISENEFAKVLFGAPTSPSQRW